MYIPPEDGVAGVFVHAISESYGICFIFNLFIKVSRVQQQVQIV